MMNFGLEDYEQEMPEILLEIVPPEGVQNAEQRSEICELEIEKLP